MSSVTVALNSLQSISVEKANTLSSPYSRVTVDSTPDDRGKPEPYVDADMAAAFLSLRRRRVLELARRDLIPAHPLGEGCRKVWRFRLSELDAAMQIDLHYHRQFPAPEGS